MRHFHLSYPLFLGVVLLFSLQRSAFAHGEDKPGPHDGVIRMPGAFHTEIVGLDKRKVAVYLLDIQFKEPTTESSSVNVTLSQDGSGAPLKCEPDTDRFVCFAPSGMTLNNGSLELVAKRKDAQGVTVTYPLPLSTKP